MIVEQVGICAWNLNAYQQCPPTDQFPELKKELEIEYHSSLRALFDLLKLIYEKNSIEVVIENLEAGTGQSISFAVELLDTFLDEDLKPYIVPLIEDSSISNKLWALESYFPLRHYSNEELLKSIINRDNNLIGKESKIYALNAFRFSNIGALNIDLVAQMFNADKFLRQVSAQIIEGLNREEYLNCKKRLSDKHRVELDRLMDISQITNSTVVDRINFYRQIHLESIDWKTLLFILYNSSIIQLDTGELNSTDIFKGKSALLFIENGRLGVTDRSGKISEYSSGDILNFSTDKLSSTININEKTLVHYIDMDKIYSSLYDNVHLIHYISTI
jgi:hypothetical protein